MTATPCQAGDPEDWFIGKDGLQYHDEPFEKILLDPDNPDAGHVTVAEQKRQALIRRRQAKEACLSCPVRLECLSIAIEDAPPYGTWGGYYEEELRAIRAERERRQGVPGRA